METLVMDAYELINILKGLWPIHTSKNSGELNKPNDTLGLYVRTPHGIWKLNNAYYDPEFGIMLDTETKNDQENT